MRNFLKASIFLFINDILIPLALNLIFIFISSSLLFFIFLYFTLSSFCRNNWGFFRNNPGFCSGNSLNFSYLAAFFGYWMIKTTYRLICTQLFDNAIWISQPAHQTRPVRSYTKESILTIWMMIDSASVYFTFKRSFKLPIELFLRPLLVPKNRTLEQIRITTKQNPSNSI